MLWISYELGPKYYKLSAQIMKKKHLYGYVNYWAQEIFLYGNIINIFEEKYYELNKINFFHVKVKN